MTTTDRKGTVRLSPEGMYAICFREADKSYPAAVRWIATDEIKGSRLITDVSVSAWEVVYRPAFPVGTVMVRHDEVAYKVRKGWHVVESSGECDYLDNSFDTSSWELLREGLHG